MMIDEGLSLLYDNLTNEDLLIVTADHGNDPTFLNILTILENTCPL